MSDRPSDPDLEALAELPDTGRFALSHPDPLLNRQLKAVEGLGKWAVRQHSSRKEVRRLVLGALLTIITATVTLVWQASAIVSSVDGLSRRIERLEGIADRSDRGWHRVDATTSASE